MIICDLDDTLFPTFHRKWEAFRFCEEKFGLDLELTIPKVQGVYGMKNYLSLWVPQHRLKDSITREDLHNTWLDYFLSTKSFQSHYLTADLKSKKINRQKLPPRLNTSLKSFLQICQEAEEIYFLSGRPKSTQIDTIKQLESHGLRLQTNYENLILKADNVSDLRFKTQWLCDQDLNRISLICEDNPEILHGFFRIFAEKEVTIPLVYLSVQPYWDYKELLENEKILASMHEVSVQWRVGTKI